MLRAKQRDERDDRRDGDDPKPRPTRDAGTRVPAAGRIWQTPPIVMLRAQVVNLEIGRPHDIERGQVGHELGERAGHEFTLTAAWDHELVAATDPTAQVGSQWLREDG